MVITGALHTEDGRSAVIIIVKFIDGLKDVSKMFERSFNDI